MLGMAIKSLTGSKTVLQILNRYGYCSSYNTIQEIETELTFKANKRGNFTVWNGVRYK